VSALATMQREFVAALFAAQEPDDPRVSLYRHNALANLSAALASTYPVVRRLVGEPFFGEAARRYALGVPSTSGDLNAYGERFAEFLAAYAPAEALAYLPDVGRLEWALHECSQAPDAAPFDGAALARRAAADAGGVRLALQPAVRLVASAHPVLAIWEANQPARDGTPDRVDGAERVLVRREALACIAEALDADEWRLLVALRDGATLGESCDALGEAAPRLPGLLSRFGAAGILRDGATGAA
jgi:hypothetical protein